MNGYTSLPATITRTAFFGDCIHVAARLATGEEAVAQVPRQAVSNSGYHVGEPIHVWWKHDDELRF